MILKTLAETLVNTFGYATENRAYWENHGRRGSAELIESKLAEVDSRKNLMAYIRKIEGMAKPKPHAITEVARADVGRLAAQLAETCIEHEDPAECMQDLPETQFTRVLDESAENIEAIAEARALVHVAEKCGDWDELIEAQAALIELLEKYAGIN